MGAGVGDCRLQEGEANGARGHSPLCLPALWLAVSLHSSLPPPSSRPVGAPRQGPSFGPVRGDERRLPHAHRKRIGEREGASEGCYAVCGCLLSQPVVSSRALFFFLVWCCEFAFAFLFIRVEPDAVLTFICCTSCCSRHLGTTPRSTVADTDSPSLESDLGSTIRTRTRLV